jgi:ketol-acid reductoisomerase
MKKFSVIFNETHEYKVEFPCDGIEDAVAKIKMVYGLDSDQIHKVTMMGSEYAIIEYEETVSKEAVIEAETKADAENIVESVIDGRVENSWEVHWSFQADEVEKILKNVELNDEGEEEEIRDGGYGDNDSWVGPDEDTKISELRN